MKKNIITNITYILDESGSMGDIKESVISGFNEYINSLKKQKNNKFKFTLTKFDSRGIRTPYIAVDINKVEKLTDKTYEPGEMTPLYDSCVVTIEKVAEEVKDNQPSLAVIMTDGFENASKDHDEKCLKDLIEKLKAKGNWTFVFMGANQNSWAVAQKFGIEKGNIMDWQATNTGTANIFAAMAVNTANYSTNVSTGKSLSTGNFFNKEGEK